MLDKRFLSQNQIEGIKRTLRRTGPNCDDFKDGFIRDLKTVLEKTIAHIEAQENQGKKLYKSLDKYGMHLDDCRVTTFNMAASGPLPCTCGINDALTQAPESWRGEG